jgi:hypothetical protein
MITESSSSIQNLSARDIAGVYGPPAFEAKPVKKLVADIDPVTRRPIIRTIIVDDGTDVKNGKHVEPGSVPVRRGRYWDPNAPNTNSASKETDD